MASRVLYVLLTLITLLLLALAPLHVRETLDWKLVRQVNVRNGSRLINQLVTQRTKNEAVSRIWELLPEDLQLRLLAKVEPKKDEAAPNENEIPGQPKFVRDIELLEDLIDELNKIIERRDFYQEAKFGRRAMKPEARELLDEGLESLADIRVKRFNRLLVAAALSPHVDQGNPTALEIQYAIWKLPFPIQLTQQQFGQMLIANLPWYFDKFVLSIGLLIAIVVTANMVPETFEPGSLNLLLSKPVSRWGLFTAKFFGGCVFIGLCAAYLFVGLWLWLGIAMGVWDRAILISIPLYIIVFAIYFSVSALIGLLYRSPIVSVMLTLLFWVICTVVGSVYGIFRIKAANDEFLALVPAGEKIISCDLLHQVSVWDAAKRQWDRRQAAKLGQQEELIVAVQTYAAPMRYENDLPGLKDFVRPVFDHHSHRILCSPLVFQFSSGEDKPLYAADYGKLEFEAVGALPGETLKLYETPDGIVAVTGSGQFHGLNRAKFDAALATAESNTAGDSGSSDSAKKESLAAAELFDPLGPADPEFIRSREQVDYNSSRDEWVVYEYGKIRVYRKAEKSYELRETVELKLKFNTNMTALLAFGNQQILIAFGNGKVYFVDADSLQKTEELQLENRSGVLEVACSPDGKRFGVLYRNGKLWVTGKEDTKFAKPKIAGQGSICTFAFGEKDACWIAYDSDRVAKYDLTDESRNDRLIPTGNFISRLYRLAIRPLYRVFPKPGEFYKVVTHLASTGDASENQDVDWNKTREGTDPWGPLRSGVNFMFGMLVIGCTIFHFKDY
jgi:hypothetical protein